MKVAVLIKRTRGPLQQHLHLNAGASTTYSETRTTITEYQGADTTLSSRTEPVILSLDKLQWRNSPNGHKSNQQRKVQRQRKGQAQGKKGKTGNQGKGSGATVKINRHQATTHKEEVKENKLHKEEGQGKAHSKSARYCVELCRAE